MNAKNWKAGSAVEVRKVMVCARDASRADDLLGNLIYILTDAGSNSEAGLAWLRGMSGAEIVDGLLAYRKSAYDSVARGLKS